MHERFASKPPDVVALELPVAFRPDLEWAVRCWPMPVAAFELGRRATMGMVVPFVPGDSIFEAFRLASESRTEIALIDVDVSVAGEVRPACGFAVGPEFAARSGDDCFAAVTALNEREAILVSDLAREAAMASALAALMAQLGSVLWVGGFAHWSRIVERLRRGDFSAPPTACAPRRRFTRTRLAASALLRLTGLYPAAPAEFEPFEAMRTLLLRAAAPGLDRRWGPSESTAPIDLARTRLYARNLAASARVGEQPHVSELVLAASATIGPRYAARLFAVASEQLKAKRTAALPPLTFEIDPRTRHAARPQAGFCFRGKRLSAEPWFPVPWLLLDVPDREQLARAAHDAEYEKLCAAQARETFHWHAYPPDETDYEAFVAYALRHANVADPAEARSVPFSTGLQDGLDVRSTVRQWHEDRIYGRDERGGRRRFRNGVIDWRGQTEASGALQGRVGGGWNDPDCLHVGSVSREARRVKVLARNGMAQVARRHREWSMITLDAPTSIIGPSRRQTFHDAVIRPLIAVQGLPTDHIYTWLETMFRFCAGKPFVYYSPYQPSARIFALARAHRVELVWCALGRLPRELLDRHRTFRQLWLADSQWKQLRTRLAAPRSGGPDADAANHRRRHPRRAGRVDGHPSSCRVRHHPGRRGRATQQARDSVEEEGVANAGANSAPRMNDSGLTRTFRKADHGRPDRAGRQLLFQFRQADLNGRLPRKAGDDLQLALHGGHVAPQGADVNIRPALEARHLPLAYAERLRQRGLGHAEGLAHFRERHLALHRIGLRLDARLSVRIPAFRQFRERPSPCGHRRPSFFSCARCASYSASAFGTKASYQRSSPVLSPPTSRTAVRRGSNA